jgi:hypothetical protein
MKSEYKCRHVKGVECRAYPRDCDQCPFWQGVGIVPVIEKKREE